MIKPKVVLLIFVSGKIVLTGAKVREEIYMAFNQIYSVLVGECYLQGSCLVASSDTNRIPQGVIDARIDAIVTLHTTLIIVYTPPQSA
jgi:hypothetical protein